MRIYFMIIWLLPQTLFAQDASKIKDYYDTLKAARHDTTIAHAFSMLCFHYSVSNPDSALYYGKKGMALAMQLKNERSIANISNSLGWVYYKQHDYAKAEELFNNSLRTWQKSGDRSREAKVMNNLALLFMDQGDYNRSLSYMQRVLNLDDTLKDMHTKAADLHTTGRLYNLMKDFKEARNFFEAAHKISVTQKNLINQARELMSIGNTYVSEEKFKDAIPFYDKCISIYKTVNMSQDLGLVYENAAGAYFGIKQYDKAFSCLDEALFNYQKVKSRTDMYYAWLSRGDMLEKINQIAASVASYTNAYNLSTELADVTMQYPVMENLARTKSMTGDYQAAYNLFTRARVIKDSIFSVDKQNELLRLKTAFDTERKEKENVLLKAQKVAADLKLQRNTVLLISSLLVLTALGVLTIFFYRNKEAKARHIVELEKLNKQLQEQKEEISRINSILELKALRARMNPHFIFNCMSSIQECMLTGRTADANLYLTKLSKLLRMVLMYSDDESITLEKELEILQLYLQLENLRLKNGFTYTIACEDDLDTADIKVPALLLQPFAENAIWHGLVHKQGNKNINIKITEKGKVLYYVVEDNGIGRSAAASLQAQKKGYQSMALLMTERRLAILNDQHETNVSRLIITDLKSKSGDAEGTKVELSIPLEYA